MGGDVEKMVAVGLIWGVTNAVMRRGAEIWDKKSRLERVHDHHQKKKKKLLHDLSRWFDLLLTWQYSFPFLVNLSASAAFFHILAGAPISVAVPVTNATTFAATAVTAVALGERTRAGPALAGMALIVVGVWTCVA